MISTNPPDVHKIRQALACGRLGCPCHRQRAKKTHCPAHDDRTPSLGIDDDDGRLLVHCWAGCSQEAVIRALRERGLWPTENRLLRPQRGQETDVRYVMPQTRLGPDEQRLYAIADGLRLVDALRRSVRQDTDQAWEILEELADIERYLLNEWELDS
jgi:rhodanese-related sulfurtransferase